VTRRGLRGVKLVISDAHEGLKAAIQRVVGATWQRCRVLHGGGDNRLLLLTSLFSHSSGFIECSFVRCCGAKVVMLGLVH
jgi:Transposase, Mutator family